MSRVWTCSDPYILGLKPLSKTDKVLRLVYSVIRGKVIDIGNGYNEQVRSVRTLRLQKIAEDSLDGENHELESTPKNRR